LGGNSFPWTTDKHATKERVQVTPFLEAGTVKKEPLRTTNKKRKKDEKRNDGGRRKRKRDPLKCQHGEL